VKFTGVLGGEGKRKGSREEFTLLTQESLKDSSSREAWKAKAQPKHYRSFRKSAWTPRNPLSLKFNPPPPYHPAKPFSAQVSRTDKKEPLQTFPISPLKNPSHPHSSDSNQLLPPILQFQLSIELCVEFNIGMSRLE